MNAITSTLNFIDDRFNPIVVKEVRQSVQSRFIVAVILFFLLIQASVLTYALLGDSIDNPDMQSGRDVFTFLHVTVLVTCFFVIPLYTLVRLMIERSQTNMDLVFVSAIRPGSIVWGKFWSAMMLASLIYSACLPFLTVTFLLRGIDGPSIFIIVGMDFLSIAAAMMSAILVGCLPLATALKRLVGLLYAIGLGMCLGSLIGASEMMIRQGIGSRLSSNDFWIGSGFFALLVVIGCMLCSGLAVAGITPASANRALWMRISFTLAWLITGAASIAFDGSMRHAPSAWTHGIALKIWSGYWMFVFCVFYFGTASERDEFGDRVLRTVPRSFILRAIYFVFSSGSAAGFLWITTLFLASLAALFYEYPPLINAYGVYEVRFGSLVAFTGTMRQLLRDSQPPMSFLCIGAYAFCYALTATLLRWWFFRGKLKTVVNTPLALGLAAVATVGPVLLGFLLGGSDMRRGKTQIDLLFIGNPFFALGSDYQNSLYLVYVFILLTAWITLLLIAGIPWFYSQFKKFKRPDRVDRNGPELKDETSPPDVVGPSGDAI